MRGFVLQVLLACLLTGVVAAGSASAEPILNQALWIDGHQYTAELTLNTRLDDVLGDHAKLLRAEHYHGKLSGAPDSWVRLTRSASGWSGLAYLSGQLHVLGGAAASAQPAAMSLSQDTMPTCASEHSHDEFAITPGSLASPMMVQQVSANYDTLCADTVNGDCLMLELELAFDLEFQTDYPDDFQDRAVSILNMVEGFYQAQLGIVFDALSVEFLGSQLFTTSTNANELLGDVQAKLANDQVPFIQNDSAIFHLISGRDFDGSVAGLAYVGTVCNANGYASGITNAFGNDSITALVVAHEIGHNLGARHDDPLANGCGSGYIMAPSISASATSFSSCSEGDIEGTISDLSAVEQCFNFPADIGLVASLANASEVNRNQAFVAHFDVRYEQAYAAADRFTLTGSVPAEEGTLQVVTVDGQPCTLALDGASYDCGEMDSPSDGLQVSVQALGIGAQFNLTQNVALISDSGDVIDIALANDQLATEFAVISKLPTDLAVTTEGVNLRLTWQDHADDESGYRVERRVEGQGSYTILTNALAASSETYLDASAEANVVYQYRVSAVGGDWDALPSNVASGVYYTEPATPAGLSVRVDDGAVLLSWDDRADNETHYLVERLRSGTDTWLTIASLAANSEAFVDTTAVPELEYRYRVFAANSQVSASSNLATAVVPQVEEEPADHGGSGAQTQSRASDGDDSGSSGGGGATGWGWWLFALLALCRRCTRRAS
ncbi:M12 family metallo-peptidase [Marinobacter sp. SS21]|uniref:M12 family metallo-peptidase n=1 Tax=Marinobacter sp. SS21 TaxID=2979460 RepID=UPI0023312DC2|nr:M12 family metallo-peptidase [Marinobacter sp. SS21]MDC0663662.1 M12 family metallo-peptidase [Marinobacter sp. SS21]